MPTGDLLRGEPPGLYQRTPGEVDADRGLYLYNVTQVTTHLLSISSREGHTLETIVPYWAPIYTCLDRDYYENSDLVQYLALSYTCYYRDDYVNSDEHLSTSTSRKQQPAHRCVTHEGVRY